MLDVIGLFQEKGTRDELGLSRIRDAFSDRLFPGTGSLMTRARYFLFIPWIYQALEAKHVTSAKIRARTKSMEVQLIDALMEADPSGGVIGSQSRAALRRFPSDIYWAGLVQWGIHQRPNAGQRYYRSLDGFYRRQREASRREEGEGFGLRVPRNWDTGGLTAPRDFPALAGFDLTRNEARFLQEQIQRHLPTSLLAFLVSQPTTTDMAADYAWDHPAAATLTGTLARDVRHARGFSELMLGASLLYNVLVAEAAGWDEKRDEHAARVTEWSKAIAERGEALRTWWAQSSDFWALLREQRGRAMPRSVRVFVENWIDWVLAQDGPPLALTSETARQMVRERERRRKGLLSRFVSKHAQSQWQGHSGDFQLGYRWVTARRLVSDILVGLRRGASDA